MSKDLLVVGAGGMGRELWCYLEQKARADAAFAREYRLKGFLDDNPHALDRFNYPADIVGSICEYTASPDELLVCALGAPEVKARVCPLLKERGARFLTLVHPTAVVERNARLGEGVVLAPFVHASCDIELEDFVFLNCHVTCGHDVRVGAYSTLSSYCDLTGGVELGERVFMGSHASVVPGRRVGAGVRIGAGSVVLNHIPAGRRVFGVPAKPFMEP
jgi:sugar O-acyltransferase (sialic acid O-acetyltransferase NeuD family)